MENNKYKGIDKTKILEVQKVKLHNADAYAVFTEAELKEICKGTDSFERLYKGIENQLKARMDDTEMAIICEMAMMYLDSLKGKEADKEAYNKGLNDAWEFIKKVCIDGKQKYSMIEQTKIFGMYGMCEILRHFTPQEALAKLEVYEKEQTEIKVGDVVTIFPRSGGEYNAVVVRVTNDMHIDAIYSDGITTCNVPPELYKKTGKHIDIQKILDELKEGVENA